MSAFVASMRMGLLRYGRSRGIWLLMLTAPIAARFWVPRDDGSAMAIAINGHLPEPGSGVIGLALGAVSVMAFLPVVWGYLRANVTRQQPWQAADVTPASRVVVELGRFAADAAIMVGLLMALTLAGWVLALLSLGAVQPLALAEPLWLIALPPLLCVAGLHRLLDGLSRLRGALGDLLFLVVYLIMLVAPFAGTTEGPGFNGALRDAMGIIRPLSGAGEQPKALAIGIVPVRAGHVPVDVAAGIRSDGYIMSRLVWGVMGVGIAALAGIAYRSPRPTQRTKRRVPAHMATILTIRMRPTHRAHSPRLGLVAAGMAAVLAGPRARWLALAIAAAGCVGEYRHVGSPAALLLLAFGLAAHTGRWASKGLAPLTVTMPVSMAAHGGACVAAAALWGVLLALPASVARLDPWPLELGLLTAGVAGLVTVVLAAVTRSATVPRLVLLLLWYGYYST